MIKGFRFYYDKDYDYFYDYWDGFVSGHYLKRKYAISSLRCYANLFNRDMRKKILKNDSCCKICGSTDNLQIDHIVSIMNGGRNSEDNIQILCRSCNIKKG